MPQGGGAPRGPISGRRRGLHRSPDGRASRAPARGRRRRARGSRAPAAAPPRRAGRRRTGQLMRALVDGAGQRHAGRLVGARDFGEHRRKGAAVFGMVAVRRGEVAIDGPRRGRAAEGGLDHLGVHRPFGAEVGVEAADRQPGAAHDAADAGGGQTVLANDPAGGGDDAIVGAALLRRLPGRRVRHSGPMLIHRRARRRRYFAPLTYWL